jgi:hypothetical protein
LLGIYTFRGIIQPIKPNHCSQSQRVLRAVWRNIVAPPTIPKFNNTSNSPTYNQLNKTVNVIQ